MKKRLLFCIIPVAVLLVLTVCVVWQNQSRSEPAPQTAPISCDASILVNPSSTASGQYDLVSQAASEAYLPVGADNDSSLCYRKDLTVHINRSLAWDENDSCRYGLFEKNSNQFAVFQADVTTQQNAERLCHLLLSYIDYFPVLLFGDFNDTVNSLLSDICQLSSSSIDGTPYYYKNLSAIPNENNATLLLQFQKTPRTLDLGKKMVALTFDDGPSKHTEQILQTLTAHNAKATFFVNGTHVTTYPDVIKDIFANGCEIGNHTNLHELFEQNTQGIIRKSIEETNKKIRNVVGIGAFVVRPPGGGTLDRYQNRVTIGYPIVRWSLDTFDYTYNQSEASILESIQTKIRNGDIVLMHDTKAVTASASESIISYLLSEGYQLVTVSELLEFSSNGAIIDRIYNNAFPD